MQMQIQIMRAKKQLRRHSNGNGHENDMTDTQNVMPSIQRDSSNLMSPNTLPISKYRYNVANTNDSGIDGQMDNDEQLLRLQNYNLLYNAERQTYFQLHTSYKLWHDNRTNRPNTPNSPNSPTTGNRLLHQVVGNSLSAAFGLNANVNTNTNSYNGQDPMMMTTQTVQLNDAVSLRQSHYNPFNPTRWAFKWFMTPKCV